MIPIATARLLGPWLFRWVQPALLLLLFQLKAASGLR
jgi:hypothetical protein